MACLLGLASVEFLLEGQSTDKLQMGLLPFSWHTPVIVVLSESRCFF